METINLELISLLLLDIIFAALLGEKKGAFREGLKMESERIFCNKCGAENEKGGKFCKKCGAALYYVSQPNKPSVAWYLLPILFGILGGIIGYIVIKVRDEKMAKNILYVGLGTFVLGIIFIAAVPSPPPVDTGVPVSTQTPVAVTPTVTQTPKPTPSEPLITKAPSEIALAINDMPTGWALSDKDGNETWYDSSFDKKGFGGWIFIDCWIRKHSTIEAAKQAHSESKEKHSDYKLESIHLGDESFGYQYAEESVVVFRKANIVVTIEYYKEYGSAHLGDAKNFAEIVEKKIV